jgi:branched-chain amino acid transport system permease protein
MGRIIILLRLAALVVILAAPFVVNAYWMFLLLQVVVTAYLALSFDVAYSYGRLLSFCQGLFFAAGAYAAAYAASPAGWGLPAMLLAGLVAGTLLGAVLGLMLMRMQSHGAIIATVILAAASALIGNNLSFITGGDDGIGLASDIIGVGGAQLHAGLNVVTYYVAAVPLVAVVCVLWALRGTLAWTVLRAVAMNDVRARQLGYNVALRRYGVFVASTAIAGFGGALYALSMNHITTGLFEIGMSVNAILFAVVGGLGTDCGALVGALIVLPATELIATVFTYVQILVGALLAVVAVANPKGIVGTLLAHSAPKSDRYPESDAVQARPFADEIAPTRPV